MVLWLCTYAHNTHVRNDWLLVCVCSGVCECEMHADLFLHHFKPDSSLTLCVLCFPAQPQTNSTKNSIVTSPKGNLPSPALVFTSLILPSFLCHSVPLPLLPPPHLFFLLLLWLLLFFLRLLVLLILLVTCVDGSFCFISPVVRTTRFWLVSAFSSWFLGE